MHPADSQGSIHRPGAVTALGYIIIIFALWRIAVPIYVASSNVKIYSFLNSIQAGIWAKAADHPELMIREKPKGDGEMSRNLRRAIRAPLIASAINLPLIAAALGFLMGRRWARIALIVLSALEIGFCAFSLSASRQLSFDPRLDIVPWIAILFGLLIDRNVKQYFKTQAAS